MDKPLLTLIVAFGVLVCVGAGPSSAPGPTGPGPGTPWRGVHLLIHEDRAVDQLIAQVPKLAALGVNVLIVEVNYSFAFKSHPELRSGQGISREKARALAQICGQNRVRLIPQLNCVGHQSWAANTAPLLAKYPQFDETPDQFPGNKGIYCRSWCPLHPDVNPIVFALMDELIDAFQADAFHVGMDEVFLIGSEHCARCRGKDTAELFARAVNDYHQHLVKERRVEMLMWADRLLDGKATGYGKWEAAENGTQGAIDKIPTDIILCDWHYGKRAQYPSIPLFLSKGFRVWPSGWDKVDATNALIDFSLKHRQERLLGHLRTTWGKAKIAQLDEFPPLREAMKKWEK